jgi:hypothetical protein
LRGRHGWPDSVRQPGDSPAAAASDRGRLAGPVCWVLPLLVLFSHLYCTYMQCAIQSYIRRLRARWQAGSSSSQHCSPYRGLPPTVEIMTASYCSWLLLLSALLLASRRTDAAAVPGAELVATAQTPALCLNLTTAVIDIGSSRGRVPLYAQLLADRVHEQARTRWVQTTAPADAAAATVSIEIASAGTAAGASSDSSARADSYHLEATAKGVRIVGFDERGVLYGVGRLLRLLNSSFHEDYGSKAPDGPRSSVMLALPPSGILNISSSPDFPMRGHQLGYRKSQLQLVSPASPAAAAADHSAVCMLHSICQQQGQRPTPTTAGTLLSTSDTL